MTYNYDNELTQAWDALLEMGISEQTLQVVTDINGYNMESMHDILYSQFGDRTFDFEEEEEEED